MPGKSLFTLIPLLVCCSFFGCKKAAKNAVAEITFTGIPAIGFPLVFHYPAPKGYTYSWYFDGSLGSTNADAKDVFTKSGSLQIMLILNSDSAHVYNETIYKTIVIYPSLDFLVSGTQLVKNTLTFTSIIPSGYSYQWDFGDGSSSTVTKPSHSYKDTGSYVVKMTVLGDTVLAMTKTITIYTDPIHTHQITGMKSWRHSLSLAPTTTILPDTSFEVNYINQLTVSIGSDQFYYTLNSSDSVLNFHYVSSNYYYSEDIYFNFISNSITYVILKHFIPTIISNDTFITK